MAQTLRLKRSSVPGRVPTTATLQTGEIAINTADGLVYIRKDDDSIIPLIGANTSVTGSVNILGSVTATSFTGSFSGSFNGPIVGTLTTSASAGTGMLPFTFDGSTNARVGLDTGSYAFRKGIHDSFIIVDTYTASGVNIVFNEIGGFSYLSAYVQSPHFMIGSTRIELASTASVIDSLRLTGTVASGSFTGSFVGDFTGTLAGTASWADNAVEAISASHALIADQAISASFTTTSSYSVLTSEAISSSYASFASNAESASYATTASFAAYTPIATSASFATFAPTATSASYATTASYANFASNAETSSYANTAAIAVTSSFATNTISASFAEHSNTSTSASFASTSNTSISASYAVSSSHALIADYALDANVDTGSLLQTGSITDATITLTKADGTSFNLTVDNVATASYATFATTVVGLPSGSYLTTGSINNATITLTKVDNSTFDLVVNNVANATSASYALSSSYAVSSSYAQFTAFAQDAISASYAATASSADNFLVRGDATVDGILTAREFHTTFISASVLYESGSTKFGDTADDLHEFTGSVIVSGSIDSDDITIDQWGSVSASLAIISASAAGQTLQQVTDSGNSTTLVISASNLNITGFPDVSASLAELYDTSASLASELTLVSATASAAYNYTLQNITDNGNSTNLVISASNLNITGFPDVSASLAALGSSNTLQGVTDNGNITTNEIIISSSLQVSSSIYSKGEEVLDFAVAMAIALG